MLFNKLTNPDGSGSKPEMLYTARTLAAMYNDDTNHLYLVFLAPILREISLLNVKFQAERADAFKLYSELRILLMSYARRIFKLSFLKNRTSTTIRVDNSVLHLSLIHISEPTRPY